MKYLIVFLRNALICLCFCFPWLGWAAEDEAERVVVVANSAFEDSVEIAKYYARQRGIPEANIIALEAPLQETISIREYVDALHNPLLNALIEKGWLQAVKSGERDAYGRELLRAAVHNISYLVTVSGVPLRIANDPSLMEADLGQLPPPFQVNRGSVDGELALLCVPQKLSMTAHLRNPFFQKKSPSPQDLMIGLRVSRLDGPSLQAVRKLIDRSIEAEKTGLKGRAYFDLGGPHQRGDAWLAAAADRAKAAHFDTDMESTKRLMDYRDRLDAPAIYMGWYRAKAYGPWLEKRWPVPPGAIGFHLHSFSATTVRSTKAGWLGPLVQQGYCLTWGNVYEPYLELTQQPQLLLERLLEGGTFGEAVAYSTPCWSWMAVAIGDPLYRPFKVGLETQLKQIGAGAYDGYLAIREVRRLQSEGKLMAALDFARSRFMEQPSLALAYELGQLCVAAQLEERAVNALGMIRYINDFAVEDRILAQQIADLLQKLGQNDLALDVYQRLLAGEGLNKQLKVRLLEQGADWASAADDYSLSAKWSSEARLLKEPPAGSKPK